MIIDTHCHLFRKEYENIEEEIEKIKLKKMKIIINGYDNESNIEAIKLAKEHSFIYCTIGFHPLNITNICDLDLQRLEEQIKSENIVGIGEIGLDYYYQNNNKEEQIKIFKYQLDLAEKYNLPVVIHNRDATEDVINILKNYKLKGVLHAFSGSLETANEIFKLGYKIGIGGVVTFKNSKLIDVIKKVELENIVLETDSPYLTPEPKRGQKNSPINVKYVGRFLSEKTGKSYEEICKITTSTATNLFDLK